MTLTRHLLPHLLILLTSSMPLLAQDTGFIQQAKGTLIPEPIAALRQPARPAPDAAGAVVFDLHGNFWTLVPDISGKYKQLYVLPAQAAEAWQADTLSQLPKANWRWLITDAFGMLWVANETQVLRMDPHHPQVGWQDLSADSAFPQDAITAISSSPNGAVLVALKQGTLLELDRVQPKGATRPRNQLNAFEAPERIQKVVTADDGAIWVQSGNKTYRQPPAADAWQHNWQCIARMPSGTHDLSGDVLDGKFYMDWAITGDFGYPSTGTMHTKLLTFDPVSKHWSTAADYGLPRGYCGVAALDAKIWTISGAATNADGERFNSTLTQVFDPTSGSMTTGPELPVAIPSCIALSSGTRLYVLGYPKGTDRPLKLYSIGPGESDWRSEPDGPIGGGSSFGTELDGKLYTVVGHRYLAIFDTATSSWETSVAPHSPRSPAVGHYQGEIWVMGGRNSESEDVSYIFSPKTKQWRKGPQLPRKLIWGCAFNIDGQLYLNGGYGYGGRGFNNVTYRLRPKD